MRLYFSWKVSLTCVVLALLMARASLWQYHRYHEKQAYIQTMEARLALPVESLSTLLTTASHDDDQGWWDTLPYRRVSVRGTFDFEHEVLLRNRRLGDQAGMFVLTPLRLDGVRQTDPASETHVLVSRGFIPLLKADKSLRSEFHGSPTRHFIALIKPSMTKKLFAPDDPPSGIGLPWVDQWLRVDIPGIEAQLPYKILPIYLELISEDLPDDANPATVPFHAESVMNDKILESRAGREEMFFLGEDKHLGSVSDIPALHYPVPVYDTVIPPGRHYGYIFEWLFMALVTLGIGVILQLRPPRHQ